MRGPLNLQEYAEHAKRHLDAPVFDYYGGGADSELTLTENRAAFTRWTLRPHMLRHVSQRDLSTRVLGQTLPHPIIIAPTALAGMAHPDGELAIVRAAGRTQTTMTLSTLANTTLEDVAAAATAPLWFQLYVYRDRDLTRWLVERAEQAGYQALILTVDTPLPGNRERDTRQQFRLPLGLEIKNLSGLDRARVPATANASAIGAYVAQQIDASLTWQDVTWLRSITRLPVLLKGILRGDDARRAVDYGAAGVIVSNHGGRQLDTTPATLDVLPEVAAALQGSAALLLDGGVRRGTDVLKALALGADAVLIGRPVLWALAVNGADGVEHMLTLLRDEFDLAMGLSGCVCVQDLSPDLLTRA